MGKGFSKQNWMWGIFGVAACSMLSFSSSAYAGTAFSNATEVQQPLRGSISVHGVVKDQNGEPIIGASVKLVGAETEMGLVSPRPDILTGQVAADSLSPLEKSISTCSTASWGTRTGTRTTATSRASTSSTRPAW